MSPEIWHNRPYDSSSDMWALGCMIYELCSLRPPFLGDSFPSLKRAVASGRYSPVPKKYSDGMHRVIRHMLRLKPKDRPGAAALLAYPEVVAKLHLDGSHSVAQDEVPNLPDMMATIVVPRNMKKLGNVLPKACYPDVRPNSPSAWTAAEQGVENKKPTRKQVPPPPPEKENDSRQADKVTATTNKDNKSSKVVFQEKGQVDRRAQVLQEVEAAKNRAHAGPESEMPVRRPVPPPPAVRAPSGASYMAQYQDKYHPSGYQPSGGYHRGRYRPANLAPPSNMPSHRMW